MKKEKKDTLTKQLGLTQEKIALLLGVKRAQWSVYDGGGEGRSLPLVALEKLGELLAMANTADTSKLSRSRQAEEKEQHNLVLQKLLRENEYQQYKLSRKIEAAEKKYHTNLKALHWLQQGVSKEKLSKGDDPSLLQIYHNLTQKSLEDNGWSVLMQYTIKLQVLQFEEKLLREEMGEE